MEQYTEEWLKNQEWESQWWDQCIHTYSEETKQITYADRMQLAPADTGWRWQSPVYDAGGRSVVDVGGGPVSLLLKTVNVVHPTVVDPCEFPEWVYERYTCAGVDFICDTGEDFSLPDSYDEAWIYNVLQHTMDPKKIITNARAHAEVVRIFEWIDIPPHQGHPHELKEDLLDEWLDGKGTTEWMHDSHCYYGVFA